MDIFHKDTGEGTSYTFDFTDELASGETISSVTSITQSEPAGALDDWQTSTDLTIGSSSVSGANVSVRVSGGVAGKIYKLECLVLTSLGNSPIVHGALAVTQG